MDQAIRKQWLNAGFMTKRGWQPPEAGTPPGAIASPVLCPLTLDGVETLLKGKHLTAQQRQAGVITGVRWADDCILTGRTTEGLEQAVKPLVEGFLKERAFPFQRKRPGSPTSKTASTCSVTTSVSTRASS
jgi:RNA-directed DNA polymerase